ncbi:MAG: redox-sensing transcriptional repressor Rex [Acidimicrobiia bacterium]|nr:redox-sensing transcriptional repressor Rex [Acidimicrobiia bacterium]
MKSSSGIPKATVERLPRYLRCLEALSPLRATISSTDLAKLSNMNAAKVRKDLSHLGTYGVRGVGYDAELLRFQIKRELGLTREWDVIIIGVGNLGSALANYGGFVNRGFSIVGLYDADMTKVGMRMDGRIIRHISALESDAGRDGISIGVITTPAEVAQDVATLLVDCGVRSILNFAPAELDVPDTVHVRQVDLATELQILSFYMSGGTPEAIDA